MKLQTKIFSISNAKFHSLNEIVSFLPLILLVLFIGLTNYFFVNEQQEAFVIYTIIIYVSGATLISIIGMKFIFSSDFKLDLNNSIELFKKDRTLIYLFLFNYFSFSIFKIKNKNNMDFKKNYININFGDFVLSKFSLSESFEFYNNIKSPVDKKQFWADLLFYLQHYKKYKTLDDFQVTKKIIKIDQGILLPQSFIKEFEEYNIKTILKNKIDNFV